MNPYENKNTDVSWVLAGLGLVYAISPIDIIPDVPVIGWVDDFFVIAVTVLNLLEKEIGKVNQSLTTILKVLKWITLGLGIIAVLLVLLLGTLIYKIVAGS